MLIVVPTPIGNREDITLRGLRLLRETTHIICESVASAKKLLSLYDISLSGKRLDVLNSHTSSHGITTYVDAAQADDVVLISDAGTPWLSDPGKVLMTQCYERDVEVDVLPWATALIPAIVRAPFATHHFVFAGFIPHKKGRQTMLREAMARPIPTFAYESSHRIRKLLTQLVELDYDGRLYIAKEISKHHQSIWYETPLSLLAHADTDPARTNGEFVVWLPGMQL